MSFYYKISVSTKVPSAHVSNAKCGHSLTQANGYVQLFPDLLTETASGTADYKLCIADLQMEHWITHIVEPISFDTL